MRISDKLIVGLLVFAIFISFVGSIVSLIRLGELKSGITGMATNISSGTASLTVSGITQITNRNTSLTWGTGYVGTNFTHCNLSTDGNSSQLGSCPGFYNLTQGFLLENTGNYNLSVNYSCDVNAETLIGGSNPAPELRIIATANSVAQQSTDSVLDTSASCAGGWNVTSYKAVTTGGDWLCGNSTNYNLEAANNQDAGVIDIWIMIPANAQAGAKTATFTFNAFSSG